MGCVYCVWWYKSPTPWYKTLRYLWLIDWLIDFIWNGTLLYERHDSTLTPWYRTTWYWLSGWLIDLLIDWLIGWLIDWLIKVACTRYNGIQLRDIELRDIDYLVYWLIDWLIRDACTVYDGIHLQLPDIELRDIQSFLELVYTG